MLTIFTLLKEKARVLDFIELYRDSLRNQSFITLSAAVNHVPTSFRLNSAPPRPNHLRFPLLFVLLFSLLVSL